MKILIGTICFFWLGVVFSMYLLSIMGGAIEKEKKEYKKAVSILFLRWLKEQDAYYNFTKNIKNPKCLPLIDIFWPILRYKTLTNYLNNVKPIDYINVAFKWDLTPQKTTPYWPKLNIKWRNFMDENNVAYSNSKEIFQLTKNLKRCIEKSKSESLLDF